MFRQAGYSHLTNDEMKLIMKCAVNRMYNSSGSKHIQVESCAACMTNWDEPEFDEKF
jgi:hypothetical protein